MFTNGRVINTKRVPEKPANKHDLGVITRNKFAYNRTKIPITERRSPDIQRRKLIKYQGKCEVVSSNSQYADDMVLPGKVRGELIKLSITKAGTC
ncbi:hypothetical protein TNCV_3549141 [Trichonephila clavipes]|nr:hypothetical protein TNCV_3549141 [Trichonephila clavipes]